MERDAVAEPLTAARAAFDRHDWDAAYERFRGADAEAPLSAPDLVRLADAAKWSGRAGEVMALLERAAEAFSADDDRRGAAAVVMDLAVLHWQRGDDAVAAGCAARARQLLDGLPECAEHGLLEALSAYTILQFGDIDGGLARARTATEIGRRTGSRDVEALGLLWQGHGLLAAGRIDEGRARIDEANACAVAGGLGLNAAGQIFCSTLWACRNVGDWRRAAEWTQVSLRWCERQRVNGFPGLCRFHRAEVRRVHGALHDAARDARDAIDELLITAPRHAGWGYMELGEIQRRLGDLDDAEQSFARALELGTDPEPGLALLELDRGRIDAARTCIRRATADTSAFGREGQSTVLPAAVTIELAAGEADRAHDAARQLRSLADLCATPAINAAATRAEGEVALARGDLTAAVELLEQGWRLWCDVDAPYEAAQTQLLLSEAHRRRGDPSNAVGQLEAAARTFDRLGARRETQRARHILDAKEHEAHAEKTFMFTDIVDSMKLLDAMGDDAWQPLLAWHDRTLRTCFEEHRGTEVKHEGDGFFVAFDTPTDALSSAAAIQRCLAEHRQAHGFAPPVRIGVHTAAATARDGDYFGRGVHEAARVAAQAGANEILATETTLALVGDTFDVTDPRPVELKGIAAPVVLASVSWR